MDFDKLLKEVDLSLFDDKYIGPTTASTMEMSVDQSLLQFNEDEAYILQECMNTDYNNVTGYVRVHDASFLEVGTTYSYTFRADIIDGDESFAKTENLTFVGEFRHVQYIGPMILMLFMLNGNPILVTLDINTCFAKHN